MIIGIDPAKAAQIDRQKLTPVSGRQFKAALAMAGIISEAEMVSPDLPAVVVPLVSDFVSEKKRTCARHHQPNPWASHS